MTTEPVAGTMTKENAAEVLRSYGMHIGMILGNPTEQSVEEQDVDIVIGIDAEPEEHPWSSLSASIKKAAKQLKGGPPGIAAVHFTDHVSDLGHYGPSDKPIKVAIRQLMEKIPHLMGILVSSQPDLQLPGAGSPGDVWFYYHGPHLPVGFPLLDPGS